MKVKICGITRLEDALLAQNLGAAAIGFIFYPKSKRHITLQKACEISKNLNPFSAKVGVFVNSSADEINRTAAQCNLTHIQLHGDERPDFLQQLNRPVIKALHFSEELFKQAQDWNQTPILIDSGTRKERGGTGHSWDWSLLKKQLPNRKIILAGGLNPENIKQAIIQVKPIAVDLSSGVEQAPGIKDPHKMKQLFNKIKELE